jgi:hypothetical protein
MAGVRASADIFVFRPVPRRFRRRRLYRDEKNAAIGEGSAEKRDGSGWRTRTKTDAIPGIATCKVVVAPRRQAGICYYSRRSLQRLACCSFEPDQALDEHDAERAVIDRSLPSRRHPSARCSEQRRLSSLELNHFGTRSLGTFEVVIAARTLRLLPELVEHEKPRN